MPNIEIKVTTDSSKAAESVVKSVNRTAAKVDPNIQVDVKQVPVTPEEKAQAFAAKVFGFGGDE